MQTAAFKRAAVSKKVFCFIRKRPICCKCHLQGRTVIRCFSPFGYWNGGGSSKASLRQHRFCEVFLTWGVTLLSAIFTLMAVRRTGRKLAEMAFLSTMPVYFSLDSKGASSHLFLLVVRTNFFPKADGARVCWAYMPCEPHTSSYVAHSGKAHEPKCSNRSFNDLTFSTVSF